ncbi:MAG: hypothetical protein JXA30_23350 [Deltaproteobacteria bacterium]|nr:hypothetical protein [Deltaproteobacteria bacterium]
MISKKLLITQCVVAGISVCWIDAAFAQSSSKAKTHDGFYLRMSLGVQYAGFDRSVEADSESVVGYESDSEITGIGGTGEITLGGTPARGLVLAGSWIGGNIANDVVKRDDGTELELDGMLQFSMLGFTIDYYFDEEGGFHLGGTIGGAVAGAPLPEESLFEFIGGWGGAIAVSTGYDWWVGQQWSLGVLGRILFAGVKGEDEREGITASEESGYLSFGLLFTAVYH